MKKILALLLAVAMVFCFAACGEKKEEPVQPAQPEWPTEPINVIVAFGAGGDTDTFCRTLCEEMSKDLGVSIVCSNVTGSSGSVAARQVKDSANDGYTVLWNQSSFIVACASGVCDFNYTDLELGGVAVTEVSDVLVTKTGRFGDFQTFLDYAKAHPGELNFGTSFGGYTHMQMLAMMDIFGLDFNIVDVGGNAEAVAACLGGDVDFINASNLNARTYGPTGSGDFDTLVLVAQERINATPDIPALSEFGTDFPVEKFFNFYFPAGTDQAIIDKWTASLEKAVASDAFTQVCEQFAATKAFKCGQEEADYLAAQYDMACKYCALMK